MNGNPTRRGALYLIPALVTLVSCGPKISSFNALPKSVCETDESTLDWDARGDLNMKVSLHRAVEGGGGTPDTLLMVLYAGKDPAAPSHEESVLVFPERFNADLTFEVDAVDGAIHATDVARAGQWPGNFVIETVACTSDMVVTVHHAGREAVLDAAGSSSTAFSGAPILGDWELEATVPSGGESPDFIVLSFTAICRTGP